MPSRSTRSRSSASAATASSSDDGGGGGNESAAHAHRPSPYRPVLHTLIVIVFSFVAFAPAVWYFHKTFDAVLNGGGGGGGGGGGDDDGGDGDPLSPQLLSSKTASSSSSSASASAAEAEVGRAEPQNAQHRAKTVKVKRGRTVDAPAALLTERDVRVTVSSPTWSTTPLSPLCEAHAYLADEHLADAADDYDYAGAGGGAPLAPSWRYLDAIDADEGIDALLSPALGGGTCNATSEAGDEEGGDSCLPSSSSSSWSIEQSTDLALSAAAAAAGGASSEFGSNLLSLSLSVRAYAPTCELHRNLARRAALSSGLYQPPGDDGDDDGGAPPVVVEAFAVLFPCGMVVEDTSDLTDAAARCAEEAALGAIDKNTTAASVVGDDGGEQHGGWVLLPGEVPRGGGGGDGNGVGKDGAGGTGTPDAVVTAVLYGHVGSTSFRRLYDALVAAGGRGGGGGGGGGGVRFVVRHMGDIAYEERSFHDVAAAGGGVAQPRKGFAGHKTYLQGYGVRLDIRNVEYRAFDAPDVDAASEKEQGGGADGGDHEDSLEEVVWEDTYRFAAGEDGPPPQRYLAGVDVSRLASRSRGAVAAGGGDDDGVAAGAASPDDVAGLSDALLQRHVRQRRLEQQVPPVYQRRNLALQASAAIGSSTDPLWTLMDVAQNLPSRASSLVRTTVPSDVVEEAEEIWTMRLLRGDAASEAPFHVLVNGRRIPVERPSFNLFSFLNTIREEDALLAKLEGSLKLPSADAYRAVRSALESGEESLVSSSSEKDGEDSDDEEDEEDDSPSVRIDVGRGGKEAILYANDIEKDARYARWPTSLQPLFFGGQYGPPSVRRNLLTLLLVIDPMQSFTTTVVEFALGLVQGGYPVRVGLLVVDDSDLQAYEKEGGMGDEDDDGGEKKWVAPSYRGDDNNKKSFQPSDQVTTASIFEVITYLVGKYDGLVALPFLMFLHGAGVEDGKKKKKKQGELDITNEDMVDRLGEFMMQAFRRGSVDEGMKSEVLERLSGEPTGSSSYAEAIKFSHEKNLKPGMSFMNGRPLPFVGGAPSEESMSRSKYQKAGGQILQEEIRNLAQLAMQGLLTENKPRSVYAMLLSGPSLYQKYHPLLAETRGRYIMLPHEGRGPLFLPPVGTDETTSSEVLESDEVVVIVTIEAVVDFESVDGLSAVECFLSIMASASTSDNQSSSGFEKGVVPAFHIRGLPTNNDYECGLTRLFANVKKLDPPSLLSVVRAAKSSFRVDDPGDDKNDSTRGAAIDTENLVTLIQELSDITIETKKELSDALARDGGADAIAHATRNNFSSGGERPADNFVVVNGRIMAPVDGSLSIEDLHLLVSLELPRSRGVTGLLRPYFPGDAVSSSDDSMSEDLHWSVADTAAFLGVQHVSSSSKRSPGRMNVDKQLDGIFRSKKGGESALQFTWNSDQEQQDKASEGGRHLKVKVAAVLDPLSEPSQRVAPILMAIRDHLKLPLRLVLSPRMHIGSDDSVPLTSYYRFVSDPSRHRIPPMALFRNLPTNHVLTMRMDIPESWNLQQLAAIQDTDNLRCEDGSACGDLAYAASLMEGRDAGGLLDEAMMAHEASESGITAVEYGLSSLLFFGQCYDLEAGEPPNGLQLTLTQSTYGKVLTPFRGRLTDVAEATISEDGEQVVSPSPRDGTPADVGHYSDTLVMKNLGYWQLRANPDVWELAIAKNSRGSEIFSIKGGDSEGNSGGAKPFKLLIMKDFVNWGELLQVERRPGFENTQLLVNETETDAAEDQEQINSSTELQGDDDDEEEEVINVFSLATGHLYERFLKIMMLSVTKRTSSRVKFWLFENFLSPSFKASASAMAKSIGCEVEYVTYKWPEWLRGQSEKQRIIWGYKILFLDVLFPLKVKKIIYVDADQVVRGDLKELWEYDLKGAPYGYVPFCDSRQTTLGFQFWRTGFWEKHLKGKPYHISALYVVDLARFRQEAVGDKLRGTYHTLSADPNSLANLDQDLPNYAQHSVKIHSLPQEWLWCESWCSDETKAASKTIDLCNNPLHKEPKVSMAKRIISGELFNESWIELDEEVKKFDVDVSDQLLK